MTRAEALHLLQSKFARERLPAARFLEKNAASEDLNLLKGALQTETVPYIQHSLKRTIGGLEHRPKAKIQKEVTRHQEESHPRDTLVSAETSALERIAGVLLHEIEKKVGLVASTASREIAGYESSKTKGHIDHLKQILEALEQLRLATNTPRPQHFDLFDLMAGISAEEKGEETEIDLVGPKTFPVVSDPGLLRLAVANGLRNAIESTAESTRGDPVVVNWGSTDKDHWVSILDRGIGAPATDAIFEIGRTTKKGHSGFGLAIARQAIRMLRGEVALTVGSTGGTLYTLRWGANP